jgi:amino acid transporter
VIRGIGLPSAVAINVATMIGAGPLITIPLVVASLHGSVSVWPWIAGALIALCDGLVFAELASRFPRSGGTYTYLREAFGSGGAGRLVAFVYVWQFFVSVPLILATGYIGFAQYSAYLIPAAGAPVVQHAIALAVGTIVLVSLYRTIPRIARTALVLGAIAVATLIVVAATGFAHPVNDVASLVPAALSAHGFGIAAFGAALVITLYDYAGYNDVCQVGDEVIAPARTIPLAILISIGIVAVTYVALNLGVFATLPIREIAASTSVASLAVERAWGHLPASVVTVAILITAFASTYGGLLGASRVPYAAALEGDFLPAFGRLHPTKHFPYVSLLAIGLLALPATLFPLDAVINALTAGAAIVAGVGQTLAVIRLRAVAASAPFRLPLYPLPALVAMSAWLFLFWSSGPSAMLFGALTLAAGGAVFLTRARRYSRSPRSRWSARGCPRRPARRRSTTRASCNATARRNCSSTAHRSSSSAARSSTNVCRPSVGVRRCCRCARSARTRSTSTCRGTGTRSPTARSTSTVTPIRGGTCARSCGSRANSASTSSCDPGP